VEQFNRGCIWYDGTLYLPYGMGVAAMRALEIFSERLTLNHKGTLPMSTTRTLMLTLAAVTGFAASIAQAGDVDLRLKLDPAEVLKYQLQAQSTDQIGAPGAAGQQRMSKQELGFTITGVSQGADGTVATLTYDSINILASTPKGSQGFNSSDAVENDATNDLARTLRPLVGKALTLTIDESGKITKVEGGEGLIPRTPMTEMANQFITPAGTQQLIGGVFSMCAPSSGLAVGGTWTCEDATDMAQMGKYARTSLFTLKSATEAEATIEFTGNLDRDISGKQNPFALQDSTYAGGVVWDLNNGVANRLTRDMQVTLQSELGGTKATLDRTVSLTITRLTGDAGAEAKPAEGQAAAGGTTTASE
jgi:Family of unknown function (DUF6263)